MAHTLLLADDSVTIQRVIELTFADEDIKVVTVGDGQQAIDRIEADRPDIVLADVGMPNRDGYEVATHVKRTAHLSHIPVLLLTGAFEPVDEARAAAAGCDGVLAKPFEPQMVINRVRELLSESHAPRHGALPPNRLRQGAGGQEGGSHVQVATPPPLSSPPFEDLETTFGEGPVTAVATPPPVVPQPPMPQPSRAAGNTPALSLDEYFDKLDAAFGGGTVAPALSVDEDVEIDTPIPPHREPPRREPPPQEPPRVEPPKPKPEKHVAAAAAPAVVTAAPVADAPRLASAFSTLLAAERGEAIPSSARVPLRSLFPALSPSNDELIDQIARRVLDRLTDHEFVSDIVVRVTERIVREEIDRLRAVLKDRA